MAMLVHLGEVVSRNETENNKKAQHRACRLYGAVPVKKIL
jgi:hypothetical protein